MYLRAGSASILPGKVRGRDISVVETLKCKVMFGGTSN